MNSKLKSLLPRLIPSIRDEKGLALITVLILAIVLSLMGTVAVITTYTDIKISGNYKTGIQAFYTAEAGIEEARARLRGVDTGTNTNTNFAGDIADPREPLWTAYIITSDSWQLTDDPDYSGANTNYFPISGNPTNITLGTNTMQTAPAAISYSVKLRHKREYDAELAGHTTTNIHYIDDDGSTGTHDPTPAGAGNIIYWGYGDPASPANLVQFSTSTATTSEPVDIITATGINGGSTRIIEVEVVRNPGPPILAAIYSKQQITLNGGAGQYYGSDGCGINPDLPPVYTLDPAVTTTSGNPTIDPDPPGDVMGPIALDIQLYIDTLETGATVITDKSASNITSWGDAANYGVWYADASQFNPTTLSLQNLTGFGILLVEGGALDLGGGFNWNGIIVCSETASLSGGGGNEINIQGSIMSSQTVAANGNLFIQYNSCSINSALTTRPAVVNIWRSLSNVF